MKIFLAVLNGKKSPGIYELTEDISLEELSQLCQSNSCQLFYIDGQAIRSKSAFMEAFAKGMNFPSYFGNNWDAFEECLTDLDWCLSSKYIIIYDHLNNFAQAEPQQWEVARDIFQSAVDYWADTDTPLYIFLKK
jgi:RNAse (barnase) inhibitor barstar